MNNTQTLALIHTSLVFLTVETMMKDLFAEILPGVRLINIVDDSLLPDVMRVGHIPPAVSSRMTDYVVAAEKTGADAILSLCSSLGPAVDAARPRVRIPVLKIDEAMAAKAAADGQRIGVMATVPTTLGPTCDLIQAQADRIRKTIRIERSLVAGAFEALMAGNKGVHDEKVFDAGRALADKVDLIAFAQASMTRLAPRMGELTGRPVLTSPRLGIENARDVLQSLRQKAS
ncbi:MAG: Asp/Glu/hydantoin racemase [Lentisphaerae bacterium]|nr:Asp/Glu/hydantoin racemase [Lentisphaerota bacterium]